jgi:hypothetical protein
MNYHFYSNLTFEPWNYENPTKIGIGGSEVSHIEMSSRLATRHNNVVSYAPIPPGTISPYRNVDWRHFEEATFKDPGIWVIYRHPPTLDNFKNKTSNQRVYVVVQDVYYDTWKEEHGEIVDKVFGG